MEDINKVRIYDAGGAVLDRYTIIFVNRRPFISYYEGLAASERSFYHPQGFGLHIECLLPNKYNRLDLGRRLRLDQLPEKVQDFIKDNYQ